MTTTHRPDPHANPTAPNGRRSSNAESHPPRQPPRLRVSDGVVTTYLHDISARHRRATPTAPQRERGEVLGLQ
ncbi:MAG: hypothetical protein ACLP0J_24175 [Solirubrobacteraceae bacterium]